VIAISLHRENLPMVCGDVFLQRQYRSTDKPFRTRHDALVLCLHLWDLSYSVNTTNEGR